MKKKLLRILSWILRSRVQPPPRLKRPCEKCGHKRLRGWICYCTGRDSPYAFLYQYVCDKCNHSHFFHIPEIYGSRRKGGKNGKGRQRMASTLFSIRSKLESTFRKRNARRSKIRPEEMGEESDHGKEKNRSQNQKA